MVHARGAAGGTPDAHGGQPTMPHDYEDLFDLGDLSDDELRDLIVDELGERDDLDARRIVVHVRDARVVLTGTVGTGGERRIAEHVLTDVVGVSDYRNDLAIDPVQRSGEPRAADDYRERVASHDGRRIDESYDMSSDGGGARPEDELDARLYGTADAASATELGAPWVPPRSPTAEGWADDEPDPGTRRRRP